MKNQREEEPELTKSAEIFMRLTPLDMWIGMIEAAQSELRRDPDEAAKEVLDRWTLAIYVTKLRNGEKTVVTNADVALQLMQLHAGTADEGLFKYYQEEAQKAAAFRDSLAIEFQEAIDHYILVSP